MKTLLFLLSFPVYADFYMDAHLSVHNGEYDSFSQYSKKHRTVHKISPILAGFEIGYEKNGKSIFFRHDSSLKQTDTGLNMLGIKVRVF